MSKIQYGTDKKEYIRRVSSIKNKINTKLKLNDVKNMKVVFFALVFAVIGSWFIWTGRASVTPVASIQAEQMILPVGASIINDSHASGGQAMMLTTPGETTGVFSTPSKATSFSIAAKGTFCSKHRWWRRSSNTQKIIVSLDGNKVLESYVNSSGWTILSANTSLSASSHTLSISYTNDNSKCAQNLYLDVTTFYGENLSLSLPAPTVAISTSPTTVTPGSTSNITWNSSYATSCLASGAWSGSQSISGSVSTGALNSTSTYNLSCTGSGGTTNASTTVTVTAASSPTTTTVSSPMGRFGYSVHINRMSDKTTYIDFAKNSNATTVRDDFMWSEIEPTKGTFNWTSPDKLMTYTAQRNLDLLVMAGYTPVWARSSICASVSDKCAPANIADYANFVSQVAKRYGPSGTFWAANPTLPYRPVQAIEIWNEPNIHFWLPSPDPDKYTAMLKSAYSAIKSVNSKIQVISAGLAPYGNYGMSSSSKMNPLNFLEKMYQAGASGSMDAIGWHPYNFAQGRTADGILSYHIASAWSQLSQTAPSVVSLMNKYGDGTKKVWATEVGAPTSTNGVSETEQASFATKSVALWKGYSWTGNYYWYDLRDDCTNDGDTECRYGAVRYDNSQKSVFGALKNAFAP